MTDLAGKKEDRGINTEHQSEVPRDMSDCNLAIVFCSHIWFFTVWGRAAVEGKDMIL